MTERGRVGESHILQVFLLCANRHCEEQSDEAIHTFFVARWIASLRSQ
jgi:hypothetical protein